MGQHDETPDARTCGDSVQGQAGRPEVDKLPKIEIAELSIGEHMLIWRRRLGLSQSEAGSRLGVSRNTYGNMERDNGRSPSIEMPFLGELYSYETCFIMRRRSGWTMGDCADQAGISRYWFNLMELGKASPERLVEYWVENAG